MIGTGDLLRWNVTHQTHVGKVAESYISNGVLLPDDIILELVKPELEKLKDRVQLDPRWFPPNPVAGRSSG